MSTATTEIAGLRQLLGDVPPDEARELLSELEELVTDQAPVVSARRDAHGQLSCLLALFTSGQPQNGEQLNMRGRHSLAQVVELCEQISNTMDGRHDSFWLFIVRSLQAEAQFYLGDLKSARAAIHAADTLSPRPSPLIDARMQLHHELLSDECRPSGTLQYAATLQLLRAISDKLGHI